MIAVLFLGALLVQLVYRWFVFSPWLFEKKPRPKNEIAQPCSVVICARNEAEPLRTNLPFILQQNHPNFEVLVIDDASTDTTREVLHAFAEQDQRLRFYAVSKKEKAGKREALALGLEKAQHSLVVLTDADCRPVSSDWLQKMQSAFGPNTDLVLGYSPMARNSGFLNAWCRFETAFTALQYFSMAARGNPYMGVGRNIAWRREVLLKFLQEQPQTTASGDDDLSVNALAQSGRYNYIDDPTTWVFTEAPASWKYWLRQKKRHLSTGSSYKWSDQFLLALFAASLALLYGTGAWLLYFSPSSMLLWVGLFAHLFTLYFQSWFFTKKTGIRDLYFLMPVWDALLAIYFGVLVPWFLWIDQGGEEW